MRRVPSRDQSKPAWPDTQGGVARSRPSERGGSQQIPACVREAAERCGLGQWAGRKEWRTERSSHREECQHEWWRFERPGADTCGLVELFHGCCVEVARHAVRDGVLPGPRQGSRRKATPSAFAAVWDYVGSYVGPSAAGDGHVGCALAVTGRAARTNNRHYLHADSFEVIAVLLRPWLFDGSLEIGRRQSCANHRLQSLRMGQRRPARAKNRARTGSRGRPRTRGQAGRRRIAVGTGDGGLARRASGHSRCLAR